MMNFEPESADSGLKAIHLEAHAILMELNYQSQSGLLLDLYS